MSDPLSPHAEAVIVRLHAVSHALARAPLPVRFAALAVVRGNTARFRKGCHADPAAHEALAARIDREELKLLTTLAVQGGVLPAVKGGGL